MKDHGAFGVGQSSWGPAVYGLVNNEKQALKLKSRVQTFLDEKTSGIVFISKANNRGAHIRLVED
jgi:beta-ribofuranosylaminobenzene 5'-phosphate synthase